MITKLTDAQRSILEPACSRDDLCIFPVTANLKGGAVGNVCKSLLERGLIEEGPAADEHTVWRHGDEGPLTLRATAAGQQAIAAENVPPAAALNASAPRAAAAPQKKPSRQAALLQLLRQKEGATVAQMSEATGWQAHSVRGALSGVIGKKLGLTVLSEKEGERGRVYRIK
jgi:hypothetical protein